MKKSLSSSIVRIGIIVLFTCASTSLSAQHSLTKVWTSDSLTLKGPESATYHAKTNTIYVSSMNAGSIAKMDVNGNIIKSDWVTGLNANKGIGFHKQYLYTAETNAVAVIDMNTGSIIKRIPVEGSVMLNDLEVDAKGVIYVSDTRTGKVYRIEDEKVALFLENIAGANGIMAVGTDVYIVGSSSFMKVNAKKEITLIGDGYEPGLDGIVMLSPNEFILSNYRGMLYYVNADGTKLVLSDTRDKKFMANDISYNPTTKVLYVPSFTSNLVTAYSIK